MSAATEGVLFRVPIPRSGSQAIHEPRYSRVENPWRLAAKWLDHYVQSGAVTPAGAASDRAVLAASLTETSHVTRIPVQGVLPAAQNIPSSDLTKPAAQAISLIDEWLADTSGYDEEAWPVLKEALDRDRLSARRFFDDESGPT